jgi:hypothetical protein
MQALSTHYWPVIFQRSLLCLRNPRIPPSYLILGVILMRKLQWRFVAMTLREKADEQVEKPVLVPLYKTQVPHGFVSNVIWVSNFRQGRINT